MDSPSSFQILLTFLVAAGLSGILSGVKSVIGFFHGHNPEHDLNGESSRILGIIERSRALWQKPGFFESIAIGRFLLDGTAILAVVRYERDLFPDAGLISRGFVGMVLVFTISHWLFPVLAQAFSPSLGSWALRLYRVYGFFFMGKLGEWLFQAHDMALKKLGIDPKLAFLGETHGNPPNADEEYPDRSGLREDEKEMIRSIFDLRETQVKEIMTPRVDIVALDLDSDWRQVQEKVRTEKFSRVPVFRESIDNIEGVLHAMDLMSLPEEMKGPDFHLQALIREAYFVPRTKKIGELLREFRLKHIHMAIVVDEYGGTAGLITLEDILEEIVGEIHDEDETETLRIRKGDDGAYLIDPVISLSELNEELALNLKPDDPEIHIDTLGGFILFIHGRVPEKGAVIRFKDYTFEVLEMDGQKMEKVRLTLPTLVGS